MAAASSEALCSAVVVGAGPLGLAAAACLKQNGFSRVVVLERGGCIAPRWREHTSGDLILPLHKNLYELPLNPLPYHYPNHMTCAEFADYLVEYATKLAVEPVLNTSVLAASYDGGSGGGAWHVRAQSSGGRPVSYTCQVLVVATGKHGEKEVPDDIPGLDAFINEGKAVHANDYNSSSAADHFRGKKVLLVGSGNNAMQIAFDLYEHGARPALSARASSGPVRLLGGVPLGTTATDDDGHAMREVATLLGPDWLPTWSVQDDGMNLLDRVVLGDLTKLGIRRPGTGSGTGPPERPAAVLDYSAVLILLRCGIIPQHPAIAAIAGNEARLVDGTVIGVDAIVLATGSSSRAPQVFLDDGDARGRSVAGYDGTSIGLYSVGLSTRASSGDAVRVAAAVRRAWRESQAAGGAKTAALVVF